MFSALRSKTVAERIQSCIAEVELVNDGERNDLVEQARRKLKMAETARDEAEAMLQEAQARKLSSSTRKLREQQRETTGDYRLVNLIKKMEILFSYDFFAIPV